MSRLWHLARHAQAIDPHDLRRAIEAEIAAEDDGDYRTRLLMHESASVLRERFGIDVEGIPPLSEPAERPGFPSLLRRVCYLTTPDTIERFLRELGQGLTRPVEVVIGGSSALILQGVLARPTDDVDLVDEVPAPLRELKHKLREAEGRYALHLAHFQSHYLPDGWRGRVQSRGDLGRLQVSLVDGLDIFVGKLFSKRDKDLTDLHFLTDSFAREAVVARLQSSATRLAGDPKLRQAAEKNWYILYGDALPIA